MKNNLENTIQFLLDKACPSIKSRVRREILCQSRQEAGVSSLQTDIINDEVVENVLASQDDDGWLGKGFHGYGSMEAGIRLLIEKDLDPENLNFRRAINALRPERPGGPVIHKVNISNRTIPYPFTKQTGGFRSVYTNSYLSHNI